MRGSGCSEGTNLRVRDFAVVPLMPTRDITCVLDGTREARVVQWDAGSYIQDQISFSQFSNDLLYQ